MILILFISILLYFVCVRCAVDYCKLTCTIEGRIVENTACKCSPGSCPGEAKELIPDKDTKNFIVKTLNDLREKIASGSDGLPAASNMAAVVYDDNVEHVAQCQAKKCVVGHDECRRTSEFESVGQNFFMIGGSGASPCADKKVFKIALDAWYSEKPKASQSCLESFDGCTGAGHFTQMIWATTTNVGCGMMQFGNYDCHILCNFGPSGNIQTLPTYKPGRPSCETAAGYPHLCKSKDAPEYEGGSKGSEGHKNVNLPHIIVMFLTSTIVAFFV